MLNIYLARHGQDQDNVNSILNGQRDMPLTEKGIEQAKEVGQKIKEAGIIFDKVYTSPLQRTRKTAEIIAEIVKAPKPEVLHDLIERDFGIMSGKSHTQIEEFCAPNILKTETVTYFLSPEGAETFPQLIERANRLIAELNEKHKDGNILLVSHGDMGKMIYCAYYKLDWMEVLKMFHFGNSEVLLLSPSSKAENTHSFHIQQHNL
jgi:broad specificity phosphatase PhoE